MSASGHIYFLRHGAFVKIGFSTNYIERCNAISACTPEETKIIAVHVGTQADEARFHRALAVHRHRLEWFRWCPEVEVLAASGLPKQSPSRVAGAEGLKAARKTIGMTGIAKALNISLQAVSQWKRVPTGRVFDVERITGIPRSELRPDFFSDVPPPSETEAAS